MNAVAKREEGQAVALSDTGNIIAVIERAARDPAIDVEKMERLMAMSERLIDRQAQQAFNEAMKAAQEEMSAVSSDAYNTHTKSRYVTYAALDRALRPIYTRHGFSLSFDTGDNGLADHVRVVCHVAHDQGFTRTYHADMPADGKGAKGGDVMTKTHAAGSAMSYGMRYLLKMIFNVAVAGEDDDGNKAGSGDKITALQAEEIRDLIAETKTDIEKFCAYLKVEAVTEIEMKDYGRAIAMLQKKRGAK